MTAHELRFGDVAIALTNQDRVVFPDRDITKGDVIAYYQAVAAVMVPHLADRPLTIERFTKGVDKGGFYQKHWQKHYPSWLRSVELGAKTRVRYPIVDTPAGLVYLANQGGIAFHVSTSRASTPDQPDLVVFDLDPPAGGFAMVRRVALLLRDELDALGFVAFVKTTGSKGLHVAAALDGEATFDEVHRLCAALTTRLSTAHPMLITSEFYKKDRKGRLYFDTGRNAYGATFVSAYSLRGRATAPVSAPVTWDELEADTVAPDGFTLVDVPRRLDEIGDPWASLRARPGSIASALRRLAADA